MLTAFDPIERTDTTPKRRSEQFFAYWNRSANPASIKERELIEKWFAMALPSQQKELRSRLRAGNEQVGSVCQELCLHALLRHQGCEVLAHPDSIERKTRPDYRVIQPDGSVFILEARTSTIVPTGPVNEQRRNRIVDRLRELRLDRFALGISEVSAGTQDLRWDALEHHIRTQIENAGGEHDFQIPLFTTADGWRVRLTAIQICDKSADKGVRFEGWSGRPINMAEELRAALKKKSSHYGAPEVPFVIAVNSWEVMCGDRTFEKALFGAAGLWGTPAKPSHTRVSAVLFTTNLWPATILMGQVYSRLYLNPWASRPYDGVLSKLASITWNGEHSHCRPGAQLHELLGIQAVDTNLWY